MDGYYHWLASLRQSMTSRSREFPFPGILHFFLMVSERESKKFGTKKSPGTGLEDFLVPKKSQNWSRKNLVLKKNIGTSLKICQNTSVDLGPGLVPFPRFL